MSSLSPSYLRKTELFFYNGIPLERAGMTAEQKVRTKICYEAYQRWMQDKQINTMDLIRRISQREYAMLLMNANNGDAMAQEMVKACNITAGKNRTPTELSSDVQALNHIIAYLSVDERAIDRMKVHDSADYLMREGKKMGNTQAVKHGADLMMQLNDNFNEKKNAADQMVDTDISITDDVNIVRSDRANYTDEEKEQMRRRYGLTQREVTEMIENEDGTWQMPDEDTEEEPIIDPISELTI